ncbi:MAG: DEAD/DEAH box helicase family protein [Oscillospiraceae bacterium]|nr:DEAD/DEAH box helicase family protein [Oscillospiraceae bacterium]
MQQNTLTLPSYKRLEKCGKNVILRFVTHEVEVQFEQIAKNTIITSDSNGNKIYIHRKNDELSDAEKYVLICDATPNIDKLLTGEQKLKWLRHPSDAMSANQITKTWHNGIFLRQEAENEPGLRAPQIGAIYAVLAHWTTSNNVATVVMPTGTGKTETMISLLVSAQCKRLLITVPSDSLRGQISEKFETFGLLKKFNLIHPEVQLPVVGVLLERFKTEDELRKFISQCNVVITTMSNVAGYPESLKNCFVELCPYYFIDEAHHTTAKTWIEFNRKFVNSKVIQFTATPFRNDGVKLNGEIVYNYPLSLAQKEHYFTSIDFSPIFEVSAEKADLAIAHTAVNILENKEKQGYTKQIIMARCENKKCAREVYAMYKENWPKYNPVIVYSGNGLSEQERTDAIENLKNGKSRIVVCVDMLGEGFDLPTLKIAALHYIRKSLTVTLQVIGRFTRTKFDEDLGNATCVANLADLSVSEELECLYAQDADWNQLLPEMSANAISGEINFAEFVKGFTLPDDLKLPLQNLRPALSTVIYRNPKCAWHYDRFLDGISLSEGDRAWSIQNSNENILIIVIARKQQVDWGIIQEVENIVWDLLVVINDKDSNLLYINGSDNNGLYSALAEAIIGEKATVIRHSDPFKAFAGINRVRLQNVGLKQYIGKNIRFRMSVGSDVGEALSLAEKASGQKAFIVGSGYEDGHKVTLGCSYKGRIWTLLTGNVHNLAVWCKSIGKKVINPSIDGNEILKETLVPEIISEIPNKTPVWIDWNEDIYSYTEGTIEFQWYGHKYSIRDTTISLNYNASDINSIMFNLEFNSPNDNEECKCGVKISLGLKDEIAFSNYEKISSRYQTTVRVGKKEFSLEEFFQLYEPCVWFIDGSSLCGNEYIVLKQLPGVYPEDRLIAWDWNGVDISKESQRVGNLRTDSIQYHVVQELLKRDYDVIYDDDNAGEIADIITLKESNDFIDVELYHLKFAKGGKVSQEVANLYEVCGQAQKSIHWKFKESREFFSHLYKRETKTYKGHSASRLIRGDIKELQRLDSIARLTKPLRFRISIVQPGLSTKNSTLEQKTLLAVTEQYLMDIASIPLNVIANIV